MQMSDEERIQKIIKLFGWWEITASSWVESEGRCVYCGLDLLDNLAVGTCAPTDHLLPKANPKYKHLEQHRANCVLSCPRCHSFKGQWDPLTVFKTTLAPDQVIHDQRPQLIERIREYLAERRIKNDQVREDLRSIVRGGKE